MLNFTIGLWQTLQGTYVVKIHFLNHNSRQEEKTQGLHGNLLQVTVGMGAFGHRGVSAA